MNFKEFIIAKLGYEPRQIDLAAMLGHSRGELVRKWFSGKAFPDAENVIKLSKILNVPMIDIQRVIFDIKLENMG